MNISRIMVHAIRVEEARAKRKNRDAKRVRSCDGKSTNNRVEIQDKPRFKKRFSNHVPSKFRKARDAKVPKPRSQREGVGSHKIRSLHVPSVEKVI